MKITLQINAIRFQNFVTIFCVKETFIIYDLMIFFYVKFPRNYMFSGLKGGNISKSHLKFNQIHVKLYSDKYLFPHCLLNIYVY